MKRIIIAVDLGHFRAYRVTKNNMESERIEMLESYDPIEAHKKVLDIVTDTAGRFGMAGGKKGAAKGYGEPHNLELEIEKRLIKCIASDINNIIKNEKYPKWYLAAGKEINNQIVDLLNQQVRAKLDKNIKSNLTKVERSEILEYFR